MKTPGPDSLISGKLWLTAPLLQILLLALIGKPAGMTDGLVLSCFVFITAFSAHRLFADPLPYSLNKVWWLFQVVFMGIVPSVQAAVHSSPWHVGDISPVLMLRTNCLIICSLFLYEIIYRLMPRPDRVAVPAMGSVWEQAAQRFRIIAPIFAIACSMILLRFFGWHGLLLRGHLEAAALRHSTATQLLVDKGLRGIQLYLSVTAILLYRQGRLSKMYLAALLGLIFLSNFPLSLPRYLSFTFYMAWLLAAGLKIFERRHFFTVLVLSALLFAGPFISITRYAGIDMQERFADPAAVFKKAYLVSDFDAYSSLCRTIQFVGDEGNTHGRQLEGVVLFFVPRDRWPTKPIGSGAFLFTRLGFDFKNVSCTYLAEGFINFGARGGLLFILLLAVAICFYDRYYWQYNSKGFRYGLLFYLVCIGMLFFLLRGDLMSSFAYTTGLFLSGLGVHLLIFRRNAN